MVRTLKSQGRLNVLARPQIMTLDNRPAVLSVGQSVPSSACSGSCMKSAKVGLNVQVNPKILPHGKVLLRAAPGYPLHGPYSLPGQCGLYRLCHQNDALRKQYDGQGR